MLEVYSEDFPKLSHEHEENAMTVSVLIRAYRKDFLGLLALSAALCQPLSAQTPAAGTLVQIPGHIPRAVLSAQPLGALSGAQTVSLAVSLPLRDQQGMDDLLRRLYDPRDPLYGHYLSPADFAARFGPTQSDCDAVAKFCTAQGLTVTKASPTRTLLDVTGSAAAVNAAFGLHLMRYQKADGTVFFAPDSLPKLPAGIAARVLGIVGLDNASPQHSHLQKMAPRIGPNVGSGPAGGFAPSDIISGYNLGAYAQKGVGVSLALVELDGYNYSDIQDYGTQFNLPVSTLTNVLVDDYSGAAGTGKGEVTLDIDMMLALIPSGSTIYVYEAPNGSDSVLHCYQKIADDNLAKSISTSWGTTEAGAGASYTASLNQTLQQMAAQGQSIYGASGDEGAYDDHATLSVDDPASMPFMCGVGGTALTLNTDGSYGSETVWGNPNDTQKSPFGSGGGGGISTLWPIPSYQVPSIITSANGSSTQRNVPDVCLNADSATGYDTSLDGQFSTTGGTSAAAPLWAAFNALVNQQRAAAGAAPLGFPNPALYAIAQGGHYAADFHDIADGSTNLFYTAISGYDNASGLGSFNGANLLRDLVAPSAKLVSLTVAPNPIVGGQTVTGTVTISAPAPDGGTAVAVTLNGSAFSLTVLAGKTTVTFTVKTPAVTTQTTDTFTATLNDTTLTTTLTIRPVAAGGGSGATHVLWNNSNGTASIWNQNPADGTHTHREYGPYAGYTAKTIADGGTDGKTRVLWDNTDGSASIWSLDNNTGAFTHAEFGPYTGYTATAVSVSTDNTTHILWANTSGAASIWNYSTLSSTFTHQEYGPFAGYTPKTISDGPDGNLRVLWDNANGTTSLWNLNNSAGTFSHAEFGPYAGYTATALSVGSDNTTHLLWNNVSGAVSLWNYNTSSGTYTHQEYGPYAGYSAQTIADSSVDGKVRMLWNKADGTLSLWGLDNAVAAFTHFEFGPFGGWTATSVSTP